MAEASIIAAFHPHEALAAALAPHAVAPGDGAHDIAHILRVFHNALRIQAEEGGDARVIAAAAMLHDCVAVEKNAPDRHLASTLAARKAEGLLASLGWAQDEIAAAAHAIAAHSYSAGIAPETLEAKILQDADRLDAIGMIGAARCFYIAGRMGSALYDPADPRARTRALDDKAFALDHFETKLFKLADGFQTTAGRRMAEARQMRLRSVFDLFLEEVEG